MTTAYTPILKLALPVTGELDGTWGDVVNDNITSMVEQAVAGLATINTWAANSHTLTTADGTTSESRCAMLVIDDDGAGNPSAAATVICPTATKSYIVRNLCGQTVTVKTSAGTGVAVPNNQAALVFCDGTNVVTGAFNGDVVGPATTTNNALVRFDGTTGKLLQNGIVREDDNGNLQNINAFIFSTSPTTIGTTRGGMFWDTANQTIQAIISDDDLTVPIGQKNLVRVYASETIGEGQVVSITGVQSERPSAVRADNSTAALSVGALGIAVRSIGMGNVGYVCTFGIVSPLDTSSLTAGLPVYVSSNAGLLTQTAPVAPAYSVAIGWVVKSDALTGSIFVNINKGVTNVGGTGTVNGLTLTGSVTSTGNLTLGGTLDLTSPPAIGGSTAAAGSFTTLAASSPASFSAGAAALPAITRTGDANTGIFFPAADTIAFTEGGVESMRLDSSGNFGLGVTPSAWSTASSLKAIQTSGPSMWGFAGVGYLSVNTVFSDNLFKYITSDVASRYSQVNGAHQWSSAPSGTAGATATFNTGMRLNADGKFSLGTIATPVELTLAQTYGIGWVETLDDSIPNIYRQYNTGALVLGSGVKYSSTADFASSYASSWARSAICLRFGAITFNVSPAATVAIGTNTTVTECMRIASSGNVGIGTNSPNDSAILDVQSTTKGVRMPNMTSTQKNAIASPAAGLMIFDTTLAKLCVYTGAAWQTITST